MRKLVLGAMALCVALTAATFTGPAFARTSGGNATPPQTSGFESLGPVTLNVWTYDNQKPGLQDVIEQMTANFEKKYPNVKINLKFMDFNSLVNTVNRALASNSGPDITEGNQGYQTDALQVKAKLILPLDKYVKAYGWNKWWGPSTWQIFQWTPDGKTFGKGPKWGVAQTGQNVVLYVNTKKLAAAGIKLSSLTNFAAFDKALTTLRAQAAEERARVPVRQQGGLRHDPLPRRHPGRLRQGAAHPQLDLPRAGLDLRDPAEHEGAAEDGRLGEGRHLQLRLQRHRL